MRKPTWRFAHTVIPDANTAIILKKITSMLETTPVNGVKNALWYGNGILNHGI